LHQVQGLRRLNVDHTKLMAMAKDDAALTPRELTAVKFARKISLTPAQLTKADYDALVKEFTPQGALEVLLQCGNFAYMNRFTDSLRLPSEDEAIKTYQETYGKSFEEVRKPKSE
jgi:alkylhydroperoxidase family enzyme